MTKPSRAGAIVDSTVGAQRVKRALIDVIEQGLQVDSCALLVGPYEVGKSDLALEIASRFGEDAYFIDGSSPDDQMRLMGDNGLLRNSAGCLIVIDEVHDFPDSLDQIRIEIDASRRESRPLGQFLILGSATLETERLASRKLGTRADTFRLTPITFDELRAGSIPDAGEARTYSPSEFDDTVPIPKSNAMVPLETLWVRGGFPQSLLADDEEASFRWRERYITKLCTRDYRHINPEFSSATIREFLGRIAANQGGPLDRSKREQRVFVDFLEDLGLVRQLRPWFPNELKRYEKSPKVYIRDSGLLHYLLARRSYEELRSDPTAVGHSWEGFCIENIIAAAPSARPFFYRSDQDEEIDLILEFPGARRLPIEIKSPASKLGKGVDMALRAVDPAFPLHVVKPIEESFSANGYKVVTLGDMIDVVRRV